MNICIINSNYELGGQQKMAWNLGRHLDEIYNVFFYSFYPTDLFYDFENYKMKIDNTQDNIKIIDKIIRKIKRKTFFRNGKAKSSKEFFNRLNNLIVFLKEENIDLIILNGGFLTSFSKSIRDELPNMKIISWQHSSAEIYFEKYYTDIVDEYKYGLSICDAVVCLTNEDKKIFSDYSSNVVQIDNMLTLSSDGIISDNISNKIAFVSRFDIESKGLDLLMEVLKSLPANIKLEFAGSGTKKEISEVNRLILENNLEHRITLLGPLNEDELKRLYRSSSIFLSTSRWEGFGLAIVEAMEFGLPVISFDTRGAKSIIGSKNENGILVDNYDTSYMAHKIIEINSNCELRNSYSDLSRNRAKDFYKEIVIKKWVSLIENVINIKEDRF